MEMILLLLFYEFMLFIIIYNDNLNNFIQYYNKNTYGTKNIIEINIIVVELIPSRSWYKPIDDLNSSYFIL